MNDYRHSAKAYREELKSNGVFYTCPEMAEYMRKLLPDDIGEIYDPTCGNGGLLSAFGDEVEKYGQDIDGGQVEQAGERLANFHGAVGDTLKNPAFIGKKFKYIIANPPFSVKWEQISDERFEKAPCLAPKSKADYAFILHILHYLTEDGTAAVMGFPGILYRGQSEGKIRKWLIEQNFIEKVIAIPPKKFEDTSIATCILILKKNRVSTDITFRDEEHDIEKAVTVEEVAANDFNLSVSTYVETEEPKEKIDIKTLNDEIRAIRERRAILEAEIDAMVEEFEKGLIL